MNKNCFQFVHMDFFSKLIRPNNQNMHQQTANVFVHNNCLATLLTNLGKGSYSMIKITNLFIPANFLPCRHYQILSQPAGKLTLLTIQLPFKTRKRKKYNIQQKINWWAQPSNAICRPFNYNFIQAKCLRDCYLKKKK